MVKYSDDCMFTKFALMGLVRGPVLDLVHVI